MRQATKKDLVIGNLVMVNYCNSSCRDTSIEFQGMTYKGYYNYSNIYYNDVLIAKILPIIVIEKITEYDDNKIDFGSHSHYDSLILLEDSVDSEEIKLWKMWCDVRKEAEDKFPCPMECNADGEVEWSYKIDGEASKSMYELLNNDSTEGSTEEFNISELKKISKIEEASELYYTNIIPNMISFINKNWDLDIKPKNYVEYLKTYEEYDELDEDIVDKMYKDAKFPIDGTAGAPPFVGRIAINNVAYSDTEQGVSPIETLIGSVWAYGVACGTKTKELSTNKDIERSERHVEILTSSNDRLHEENLLLQEKLKTIVDALADNGITLDSEFKLRDEKEKRTTACKTELSDIIENTLSNLKSNNNI